MKCGVQHRPLNFIKELVPLWIIWQVQAPDVHSPGLGKADFVVLCNGSGSGGIPSMEQAVQEQGGMLQARHGHQLFLAVV